MSVRPDLSLLSKGFRSRRHRSEAYHGRDLHDCIDIIYNQSDNEVALEICYMGTTSGSVRGNRSLPSDNYRFRRVLLLGGTDL